MWRAPAKRMLRHVETGIDIRPLGQDDRSALERFFEHLSAQARYFRFFAPMPRLPQRTVDALMDVDGDRHAALAAWRGNDLIAEARYVAFDEQSAEVAVTVHDTYQRRGIGTGMLAHVMAEAARHGVCRLTAGSLFENDAIRRLLVASGFVETSAEDGTYEWERNACLSVG